MPSSSLSCGALAAWTLAAAVVQIVGIGLFVLGFFPVKPALPGVSGLESFREPTCNDTAVAEGRNLPPEQLRSLYEDILTFKVIGYGLEQELSEISPKYDRLIVMVIDGLPAEFVLGKGNTPPTKEMMDAMPFTQYLLSNKNAIGYHAKAAPPTVTMPRLKAIVSGAIGGFLDVAFNFNTQAFQDDNLLGQLYHIGWNMVMHGDETWIKLFPRFFSRKDGVSSFYVKDTVEVDYNVSRHLELELAAYDWDLMILHYLGLDHVGHIGGRQSALMIPKLNDMDKVIEKICTSANQSGSKGRHTLLLVTSDHGMTDGGNHGGSSYEETDALALFVDLGNQMLDRTSVYPGHAFQVDIAPTLALLFGVPIPKNNVGVLLMEVLDFLTDEQKLRALELNTWQLLRLLHSQIPGLVCRVTPYGETEENRSLFGKFSGDIEEKILFLYSRAAEFHKQWKECNISSIISLNTNNYENIVEAYLDFLVTASKWLSNRATDKSGNLITAGILLIGISTVTLLKLLLCVLDEITLVQKKSLTQTKNYFCGNLDEACVILGIFIHTVSLGSSSMVEEEQYIWHFLASTLYVVFIFMEVQTFLTNEWPKEFVMAKREEKRKLSHFCSSFLSASNRFHIQIFSLLIVLTCGRILRGWHQGGVNWLHLPDISKWLERSGCSIIKFLQIASLFLVSIFSIIMINFVRSVKYSVTVVSTCHFASSLLVLLHIKKDLIAYMMGINLSDNLIPQILYAVLLATTFSSLVTPWFVRASRAPDNIVIEDIFMVCLRDYTCLIGGSFTAVWCLLQLLLQHPIDSMPLLLLLLQILGSMIYFISDNGYIHKHWVEVAAMYFLGMAGHFSLGNSNSIATVDVAGAFTGLSGHSTVLAGFLMFAITYASPLLFHISSIMRLRLDGLDFSPIPTKSELSHGILVAIGLPCLVPLVFNSIQLITFTVILLLMRNHLFVWSVFSPKYLYICAATASIYIGVSVISVVVTYVFFVLFYKFRENSLHGPS